MIDLGFRPATRLSTADLNSLINTALACSCLAGGLEGFQRFDLSNRVSIVSTLLRGSEMGLVLLFTPCLGYIVTCIFPPREQRRAHYTGGYARRPTVQNSRHH